MFTGIIHHQASIRRVNRLLNGNTRLIIQVPAVVRRRLRVDDSVAVDGVCLTIIALGANSFSAEAIPETLRLTTLGGLQAGQRVNIELSLRASDALCGHMVMGHVDGVGVITALVADGGLSAGEAGSRRLTITPPLALMAYFAPKGTVALNGVSLTITEVTSKTFGVALIPHTLAKTNLGRLPLGARLNIEIDPIARLVVGYLRNAKPLRRPGKPV